MIMTTMTMMTTAAAPKTTAMQVFEGVCVLLVGCPALCAAFVYAFLPSIFWNAEGNHVRCLSGVGATCKEWGAFLGTMYVGGVFAITMAFALLHSSSTTTHDYYGAGLCMLSAGLFISNCGVITFDVLEHERTHGVFVSGAWLFGLGYVNLALDYLCYGRGYSNGNGNSEKLLNIRVMGAFVNWASILLALCLLCSQHEYLKSRVISMTNNYVSSLLTLQAGLELLLMSCFSIFFCMICVY